VRLVAVARGAGRLGPGGGWHRSNTSKRILKSEDSAVELRSQPDRVVEERDEPAVTAAALVHDFPYIAGDGKATQRVGDRGMHPAHPGKPRPQDRLEQIQLSLGLFGLQEALVHLPGGTTPQVPQRSVPLGELTCGDTEQQLGRTRVQLRSY